MMNIESLEKIIKSRRAVFPKQYNQKPITKETILRLLENANWAPNHKHTEPWRFKIYMADGLQYLSDKLGDAYKKNFQGESFSEMKFKKTVGKPLQCAAVLGIIMKNDAKANLPEWEEVAAVACAVQNIWLSCTALGIGCYWSSPGIAVGKNDFMDLKDGEQCLGFMYMGYWDQIELQAKRGPISEKIQWVTIS